MNPHNFSSLQDFSKNIQSYFFNKIFTKKSSSNLQIDALDGLRAMAIIFVLLSHFSNSNLPIIPNFSFSGIGKAGVFLFFVLSSFLLTGPFFLKPVNELFTRKTWRVFFLRRFLRIYPLFIFILLFSLFFISVLQIQLSDYQITFSNILNHLLLREGNSVLWSIPVEFKYYFVLPVIVILYFFLLKKRIIPAFLVTLLIIGLINFLFPPESSMVNDVSLIYYLPIFLCGSFTALIHSLFKSNPICNKNEIMFLCEFLAILSFTIILVTIPNLYSIIIESDVPITFFSKSFLMYGILWSVFTFGMLNGIGWIREILSNKLMRLIGICSFSIYLWHSLIIDFFLRILDWKKNYSSLAIIVSAIFIISILSYLYIEKPFLNYGTQKNKNRD